VNEIGSMFEKKRWLIEDIQRLEHVACIHLSEINLLEDLFISRLTSFSSLLIRKIYFSGKTMAS